VTPLIIFAIVVATILLVLALSAFAVAAFFVVKYCRDLLVCLRAISAVLAIAKEAEVIDTFKAIRTVAHQLPIMAQQFNSLRIIVEQMVKFAMQAPAAEQILGWQTAVSGDPTPGKAYPTSDERSADIEDQAILRRAGMETSDFRAPDVASVHGQGETT
jgi:hypothetical protein